jgi:molecular chaperone IbpA
MRNLENLFGLNGLDKHFVGFDTVVDRINKVTEEIAKNTSYPPYNICKTGETSYLVEMAVAGFGKKEIDIEITEGKLVIKGNVDSEKYSEKEYLFKGLANRSFTRTFILEDEIEIKGASLVDGILLLDLERIVPETKKSKKITLK